jgi:hypothetical protein
VTFHKAAICTTLIQEKTISETEILDFIHQLMFLKTFLFLSSGEKMEGTYLEGYVRKGDLQSLELMSD